MSLTVYFQDDFIDVTYQEVTAHTPNVGVGWTKRIDNAAVLGVGDGSDTLNPQAGGNGEGVLYSADGSGSPGYAGDDYSVEVSVNIAPPPITNYVGARLSGTDPNYNMYLLEVGRQSTCNATEGVCQLFKCVAGTWSSVTIDYGSVVASGDTLKLTVYGNHIRLQINGDVLFDVIDSDVTTGPAVLGVGNVQNPARNTAGQSFEALQVTEYLYATLTVPVITVNVTGVGTIPNRKQFPPNITPSVTVTSPTRNIIRYPGVITVSTSTVKPLTNLSNFLMPVITVSTVGITPQVNQVRKQLPVIPVTVTTIAPTKVLSTKTFTVVVITVSGATTAPTLTKVPLSKIGGVITVPVTVETPNLGLIPTANVQALVVSPTKTPGATTKSAPVITVSGLTLKANFAIVAKNMVAVATVTPPTTVVILSPGVSQTPPHDPLDDIQSPWEIQLYGETYKIDLTFLGNPDVVGIDNDFNVINVHRGYPTQTEGDFLENSGRGSEGVVIVARSVPSGYGMFAINGVEFYVDEEYFSANASVKYPLIYKRPSSQSDDWQLQRYSSYITPEIDSAIPGRYLIRATRIPSIVMMSACSYVEN